VAYTYVQPVTVKVCALGGTYAKMYFASTLPGGELDRLSGVQERPRTVAAPELTETGPGITNAATASGALMTHSRGSAPAVRQRAPRHSKHVSQTASACSRSSATAE
jgi:hypothetical protein